MKEKSQSFPFDRYFSGVCLRVDNSTGAMADAIPSWIQWGGVGLVAGGVATVISFLYFGYCILSRRNRRGERDALRAR